MEKMKICQNDVLLKDDKRIIYIDSYGEKINFSSGISFLLWWQNTGGPTLSREEKEFILL